MEKMPAGVLYFDGGSRGNPGRAAGGAVIIVNGGESHTAKRFLPYATNNEAEYTGLIVGLNKAKELGIERLEIKGDSNLVVNQIKGLWKVKSDRLFPFYNEALQTLQNFAHFTIAWIPREQNNLADTAVNQCIEQNILPQKDDEQMGVRSNLDE
jgi:ribonuclease HI